MPIRLTRQAPRLVSRALPRTGELGKEPSSDDSLLRELSRGALSSVAAAGNLLDLATGASSLRDLASSAITGNWQNPLDQFLTPFSHENRVRGRDLLEQADLIGPNTSGLDVGDVLGFGTEVALDPGLAGLKLLGTPLVAAGNAAGRVAGKTRLGRSLGTTGRTVGREARRLFDPRVMATSSPEGQKAAEGLFLKRRGTRQDVLSETLPIGAALRRAGEDTPEAAHAQREALEGVSGTLTPELEQVKQFHESARLRKEALGGQAEPLEDVIEFAARRMGHDVQEAYGRIRKAGTARPLSAMDPADVGRMQQWKGFHGGSEGVNDLLTDPEWQAIVETAARPKQAIRRVEDAIASKYGDRIDQFYLKRDSRGVPRQVDRYRELAETIVRNPELREKGLFTNHWLVDANESLMSQEHWSDTAETIYDLLATPSVQIGMKPVFRRSGERVTTIRELLREQKIKPDIGAQQIAERMGLGTLDKKALKEFGRTGIREDVAEDIRRLWPNWKPPEDVHGLVKFFDSYQSLFKAGVLTWPARYVRDVTSGFIRNFERGMADIRSGAQAHQLLQGRAAKGLADIPEVQQWLTRTRREVTDETASDAVREIYAAMKGNTARIETEGFQSGVGGLDELLEVIPGQTPLSAGELGRRFAGAEGTLNPLDVRGVTRGGKTLTNTTFGPAMAGDLLGRYTDDMNRLVPLINQMKKGRSARDAMREINFAQVDYSPENFTKFESAVLRRVFPFYSFCMPLDHEILTRDGWKTADQVEVGEEALTMNPQTERLEWQPVQAVNVFEHAGEINEFRTRASSFLYTDGHRWLTATSTSQPSYIKNDGTLVTKKYVQPLKFKVGLTGGQQIPHTGLPVLTSESILSPRHAAILGWVVTDGYFRWKGSGRNAKSCQTVVGLGSCEMMVYQHPKKDLNDVISLLGTQPRKPHPDTGVVCVPVAREDIVQIVKVFREKSDLREIAGRLSSEAAEAMWQAMFAAEGWTGSTSGQSGFTQGEKNRSVVDAFQILSLVTGRGGNITECGSSTNRFSQDRVLNFYLKRNRRYHVTAKNLSKRVFFGTVWCPTTANGTWVCRHNGSVIITGNSSRQIPYLAKELVTNPSGRLGKLIRASRLSSSDDPMPSYVGDIGVVPLGRTPSGSERLLTGLGLMHEEGLPLLFGGRPGMDLISRMTPALKGPLEAAFGESTYFRGPEGGRELTSMDPLVGGTVANVGQLLGQDRPYPAKPVLGATLEQAVANSPLSRLFSTLRTATDPRKYEGGLFPGSAALSQLLSGVRVTDVSPKQRLRALEDELSRAIKEEGGYTYRDTRFSKQGIQRVEQSDPERAERMKSMNAMLNEIQKQRRALNEQEKKPVRLRRR